MDKPETSNPGWCEPGGLRHSLVKMGAKNLKKKPISQIYDVGGLENSVIEHVTDLGVPRYGEKVTNHAVDFHSWEFVIDSSKKLAELAEKYFGRLTAKRKRDAKKNAPGFVLGFTSPDTDEGYVIIGRGGTFMHPRKYADNHYIAPIGYSGPAMVLPEPIEFYAVATESGTGDLVKIPFKIRGFVGLETRVNNEIAAGKPERQLVVAGV
ncbi:MAG: hypothetical protein V1702_04925 [Candidatus Woesearchaeota archaeon]